MGTTINSIHVYSREEISFPKMEFASYSQDWYTVISAGEEASDLLAKRLSRSLPSPVLWFFAFDSDGISFRFYQNGKVVSRYSDWEEQNKGIYQIPALVGYESGEKRRISQILACGDFDLKILLLEEFFGVCLLPFPDLLEEDPHALTRVRGEAQYLAFRAEEKKLRGKNASIKAVLVSETCGKIFKQQIGQWSSFPAGYYYFGYDTEISNDSYGNLRPVHFSDGKLLPAPEDVLPDKPISVWADDERYSMLLRYALTRVVFTEKAPSPYAGKTLELPSGFYPLGFDGKGRFFLSNGRSSVAVMDPENKIISRFSVKGEACQVDGEFILTAGSESYFAYEYNPKQYVRIYRICDTPPAPPKSPD